MKLPSSLEALFLYCQQKQKRAMQFRRRLNEVPFKHLHSWLLACTLSQLQCALPDRQV